MSLLEELARNSYSLDFDLQEMLGQPLSPNRSRQYSRQIKIVTQQCPLSTELLKTEEKQTNIISISSSLNKVSTGQESDYYQSYRLKLTKMNGLVSLLSAKTRKIMYQFFVRLERFTKVPQPKTPKIAQNKSAISSNQQTVKVNKFNQPLLFSRLEPLVKIIKGKERTLMREAFKRVHRNLRNIMKTEYIVNSLQTMQRQRMEKHLRCVFNMIKVYARNQVKPKVLASIAKGIIWPRLGKCPKIKSNLHLEALECTINMEPAHPSKLATLFPQKAELENKDYCDSLTLFMHQEQNLSSEANSRSDELFGVNGCISAYFDRNTMSPKSYIKNLSQVQLTSIPPSAAEKRRVSDFTASVGDSIAGNNSHVHYKSQMDNVINPTRSQVALHNESLNKNVYREEQDEKYNSSKNKKVFDPFSNLELKDLQNGNEDKEIILRSQSELKICRTERKNIGNLKQDIQFCYNEQMNRYLKFKRSLLERRRSTLKQIEKSQEVIKRLMQKYDDSKDKIGRQKVTLKNQKNRECSYKNSSKNSQMSSKKTTPVKRSPRRSKVNNNIQDMSFLIKDCSQKKLSLEQSSEPVFDCQMESPKNMEVFFSYVTEKKRMLPEKSPSNKKSSKNKSHQSSTTKKSDKKVTTPAARKSILALSNFPATKEQRLDLKLDLTKDQGKKVQLGGLARQSFKTGAGPNYKQKLKAFKK